MDPKLAPIVQHTLVPVVVIDDAAHANDLAAALVAGGLPVAEVTFRTAAAPAAIEAMAARGDILVGAGTVRTPQQAQQAVAAGAAYIVSPGLSTAVVQECARLDVPILAGAVTPTEIQAANDLGLHTVKFFPAETAGGAPAIKALSAPFHDVEFVPTGGIGPSNLAAYLAVPSIVGVGGSWMCQRSAVSSGDFAGIAQLTREAVQLVKSIKEPR